MRKPLRLTSARHRCVRFNEKEVEEKVNTMYKLEGMKEGVIACILLNLTLRRSLGKEGQPKKSEKIVYA